ncbi:MAG: sigma factor-like helix-turn-helix DNA-binding protein, partial [Pseudomonadota bacterium]
QVAEIEAIFDNTDLSLNAHIAGDENGKEWIDNLEEDGDNSTEFIYAEQEQMQAWREIFKRAVEAANLKPRHRYVFEQRNMLEEPRTLESLSNELDISKERVRQLDVEAFDKVKAKIKFAETQRRRDSWQKTSLAEKRTSLESLSSRLNAHKVDAKGRKPNDAGYVDEALIETPTTAHQYMMQVAKRSLSNDEYYAFCVHTMYRENERLSPQSIVENLNIRHYEVQTLLRNAHVKIKTAIDQDVLLTGSELPKSLTQVFDDILRQRPAKDDLERLLERRSSEMGGVMRASTAYEEPV